MSLTRGTFQNYGAKEKSKEIAKEMLKENMQIEIIMKITKLTKEEILEIEKD